MHAIPNACSGASQGVCCDSGDISVILGGRGIQNTRNTLVIEVTLAHPRALLRCP